MNRILKLLFLSLFAIGTGLILTFIYLFYKFNNYSAELGRSPQYFLTTVYSAIKNPLLSSKFNILILGMDERNDWLEKNQNTDTIILASYNLTTNKINFISLPRDLWDEKNNQKINLIYEEGLKKTSPISYIKESFSRITGQKIDRILVLNTRNLEELINIVGGVDVYLDKSYSDSEYPNPEYISSKGKAPMYITVEYQSGWNHIDSSNIAPFVRSRKGGQTVAEGGTDLGRINRQQLLIDALLIKMRNLNYNQDFQLLADLYKFWHQQVQTDISDQDLINLLVRQKKSLLDLSINKTGIPVGTGKTDGLIYHPDKFKNNQWVFLPSDSDWSQLHDYIKQATNN